MHARAAGDQALATVHGHVDAGCILFYGPGPLDEVIQTGEELLVHYTRHEVTSAAIKGLMGEAVALMGDADRGRSTAREGSMVQREAGLLVMAASTSMGLAYIEMAAGDLVAAEQVLQEGAEELDRLGDRAYYATVVLVLAVVLKQQGRYDEARAKCGVVRETTGPDDRVNVIGVDALEGYLVARSGDLEGGERLVRRAAVAAGEVDFFWVRGVAFELLGETFLLAGKRDEAVEAFETALRIHEGKGDAAGMTRLREHLAPLTP